MTAIAVAFDHSEKSFVIASDGRCATSTMPVQIKTDTQQKIHFEQTQYVAIVYAMTGLAAIGSFETMTAVHGQIQMLSKRKFNDGYEYADKLCFNLTKVFEKALEDGRIPMIPMAGDLPPEETGRLFRLLLFGHFRKKPFLKIASFYYNENVPHFRLRAQDEALSQNGIFPFGSDEIARMIFGDGAIDPRIAHFKYDRNHPDAQTATTNFVKACSHPAALEIDPWCRIVGGHIHAAELTKNGFAWLIPPTE